MTERRALPNRHKSESFGFECNELHYVATVGFFADGGLAEIFLSNSKAGSHSDSAAKDSAVVASIALQFGVPLNINRRALLRDARDVASSPLGVALDIVASENWGTP
jgi:ribonucleoside-diphosphate reductase alpha chain